MSNPADIDVIYTTFNEEANLPTSLASVAPWANQIFVVDSHSTDRTREIAEQYNAHWYTQTWLGYAGQKNWALDNLPLTARWVLIIDADEVVQPDLRDAMLEVAAGGVPAADEPGAYYVNRYFLFLGKPIWRCAYYPSWNIRFIRPHAARYEPREVHEQMIVDGPVGYLAGHLEHWDRRGVSYWNAKHNDYAEKEAREIYKVMLGGSQTRAKPRLLGTAPERRRWIKHHIYPRLPAKWLCRFLYMYVLKLGFLDGLVGFRFCLFISSYELMIALNLKEYQLGLKSLDESAASENG
jgi:glycosyltransferase involved in cell wall biosynthesis